MTEEVRERIKVGRILVQELEKCVKESDCLDEDVSNKLVKRAHLCRMTMQMFCIRHEEPPEMCELIYQLDEIIKMLEQMHNKHVADM